MEWRDRLGGMVREPTADEAEFLDALLDTRPGLETWLQADADGTPWLTVTYDVLEDGMSRTLRLDFDADGLVGGWSPTSLHHDDGVRAADVGITGDGPDEIRRSGRPAELALVGGAWFDRIVMGAWSPIAVFAAEAEAESLVTHLRSAEIQALVRRVRDAGGDGQDGFTQSFEVIVLESDEFDARSLLGDHQPDVEETVSMAAEMTSPPVAGRLRLEPIGWVIVALGGLLVILGGQSAPGYVGIAQLVVGVAIVTTGIVRRPDRR